MQNENAQNAQEVVTEKPIETLKDGTKRGSFDLKDPKVLAWVNAQGNLGTSIRLLIHNALADNGDVVEDYIETVIKKLTARPTPVSLPQGVTSVGTLTMNEGSPFVPNTGSVAHTPADELERRHTEVSSPVAKDVARPKVTTSSDEQIDPMALLQSDN